MPFNLISCGVVDSEKRAISWWAVWYPAPECDYLGFTGLAVLTSTQLLSENKRSVLVIPRGQTRGGMMSGNDMSGVFFQDNQTSGMSHSLTPSLNSTSNDMWQPKTNCHMQPIVWYKIHMLIYVLFFFAILQLKPRFSSVCSGTLCSLWMRPAALNPTVSTPVFPHRSPLSLHWWLKPKSLSPQSAEGSLGYQLSSIARERHQSRAWYISKAQYCLSSWLQFSKHLVSEIWADTSKSGVANWHMCTFSFNRRARFDS